MRHHKATHILGAKECIVYSEATNPKWIFVQPVDDNELDGLDTEIAMIEEATSEPFLFIAFRITDWNSELTPWPAPPEFGKTPFGDGADKTLHYVEKELPQIIKDELGINTDDVRWVLGGYSLAGLFALYVGYNTAIYTAGIVAASPSVWYKDWLSYAISHDCKTDFVYLSLGNKESKTKNLLMASVDKCIAEQGEILKKQGVSCMFEWNEGNHFKDNAERTAKGFVTVVNNAKDNE